MDLDVNANGDELVGGIPFSLDDEPTKDIQLVSIDVISAFDKDQPKILFPLSFIKHIKLFWVSIQGELDTENLDEPLVVDIPYKCLLLVHRYLDLCINQYKSQPITIPHPLRCDDLKYLTNEHEAAFIIDLWQTLPHSDFFALIQTCNFIDCPSLFYLALSQFVITIKNTPETQLENILYDDRKK